MSSGESDIESTFLETLERDAVRFARGAGAILLEGFRKPIEVEYKSADRRDPVTEVDRKAEAYLRNVISAAYPDHGIVGEEAENSDHGSPEFAWVLDPLDGTTNFLNGLPVFASSIGVLRRGVPVVAAVFIPGVEDSGGSVYHARLGGGAFQDGHPISVSGNSKPERGRLTGLPSYYWRMFGFKDGLRQRIGEIRSMGSIAYEMAMTCRGTFQLCVFNAPKIWDVAGGVLLVREAGGDARAKASRRAQWERFVAFRPDDPSLTNLREWRGAVVAGNPELVEHVGERVQQRNLWLIRMRRLVGQKVQAARGRHPEAPARTRALRGPGEDATPSPAKDSSATP